MREPSEILSEINPLEEQLSDIYRRLRPLRAEYAEAVPAPEMPAPRYRTVTQEKVARCPRCGGKLDA